MSLPVYLAATTQPDLADVTVGQTICVGGDQAKHAVGAKRLRVGEALQLVDGRGRRVSGQATDVARGSFTVTVTDVATEDAPAPRLILVQALAKNKRDVQACEAATEVGVDAIYPWAASRCVVTWKSSDQRKEHRWRAAVTSAAEQSRRAWWPTLHQLRDTAALCDDVRAATERGEVVLVAHEQEERPLADILAAERAASAYWVIVGPEGGITDDEVSQLAAAGAHPVRLGPTIMRASTAGPAALAVIAAATGRWSATSKETK
ncbi:MAG: 16S rRNA (uracil(1498)-N(3))-methyltransferase [Actinomycetaceae bacterium]|nr:16S rRNA (uracil(1498)-N(3))-methyltransferase [Actinomycetaceae bacterium]MDU0970973.1 16S rRNA (uracil(1498)-N(3))-methyltransferase [Actinomycetaceae bacterium]